MKALSVLIKPVGERCNQRCLYCHQAEPEAGGELMSDETLENIVRKTLDAAEEWCTFGFQGGEPTLAGLDFFRRFIELEGKHNRKNLSVQHTLHTNALNLDADWAAFLKEHGFVVTVSLDASKQIHDQMRPDAAGKGTHNRALDAIRLLQEHGVEYNIATVLTKALAKHPDRAYKHYRERNLSRIHFLPCRDDPTGRTPSPHVPDNQTLGKFLSRVFDLWHEDLVSGNYLSISQFDNYVHMLAGYPPGNCAFAGQCQAFLVVDPNGDVHPCDLFPENDSRLGNINTDAVDALLEGANAKTFAAASTSLPPACQECEYLLLCRGGCRRDREPLVATQGLNTHCSAYQSFFSHALPKLRKLAHDLYDMDGKNSN